MPACLERQLLVISSLAATFPLFLSLALIFALSGRKREALRAHAAEADDDDDQPLMMMLLKALQQRSREREKEGRDVKKCLQAADAKSYELHKQISISSAYILRANRSRRRQRVNENETLDERNTSTCTCIMQSTIKMLT